jgi:Fe-S-cluster containining protein
MTPVILITPYPLPLTLYPFPFPLSFTLSLYPFMIRCLSIHASYGCRHAGACCEQDWHIPVEPEVLRVVGALGIRPLAAGFARVGPDTVLARHPGGACVFLEAADGRLCSIHRQAGPGALPSACRHFPRLPLRDDRGTFIGMSHFCPTAAAMLLDDGPLEIVEAPASLDVLGLEGFEARAALPPLLRPGLLADLDAYTEWEAACIRTLGRDDIDLEAALGVIAAATARARTWTPGPLGLRQWIADAFELHAGAPAEPFGAAHQRHRAAALEPVSPARFPRYGDDDEATWALGRRALRHFDRAIRRFLAARLFACPVAYEGQGLLTLVEWLRTCLAVLQRDAAREADLAGRLAESAFVEAVRRADLALAHQADTRAFAHRAARTIEGTG